MMRCHWRLLLQHVFLKFQLEVTATIHIFKIPVPVLIKRVFSDMNLITFTAMT